MVRLALLRVLNKHVLTGLLGVLSTVFTAAIAFAASGDGQEKTGLPQFDISTASEQIFWLIILFTVFYFLMSRLALPRLLITLEARSHRISTDLNKSQLLKDEAEKAFQEFQSIINQAQEKALAFDLEARQKIAHNSAEKQAQVDVQINLMIKSAEERIKQESLTAIDDVKKIAAETVILIVQKLSSVQIDIAVANKSAEKVMKGIH